MEAAPVAAVLVFDFLLLMVVLFGARAKGSRAQSALMATLFFCSGFPALIYQIVWQRVLFSIYGVNVQSVAVVVSAFMLGLGSGLGFALGLTDALLVALASNAIGAVAHFVSHFVDRGLGGTPSDPVTFGVFALLIVGLTVWRARRLSHTVI